MLEKKKRISAATAVCILCILLAATGVRAFYTETAARNNTVTVGENVTQIQEVFQPPELMEKGKEYTKKVTVRNQGSVPCYVRVLAEAVDPVMSDALKIDWNQTEWTSRQEDGYYYYRDPLPAGSVTVPLFTTLRPAAELEDFRMIIYSESVQAEGASSPQEAFREK